MVKLLAALAFLGAVLMACDGSDNAELRDQLRSQIATSVAPTSCDLPQEVREELAVAAANEQDPGGYIGTGLFAGGEVIYYAAASNGFVTIPIEPCFAEQAIEVLRDLDAWWGD